MTTICDKINTVGNALQDNLNDRGVDCTYGVGTGKSTLLDMANLINTNNLLGKGDAVITITASRPYLLSDETTDLIISLKNGIGQSLQNKTVTISDGTNTYNGITNSNGEYTLYNITVTEDTTFTATYSNVSDSVTCIYADFVDYGVSSNYTNWSYNFNMTLVRTDAYTYTQPIDGTNFSYTAETIANGNTVELDVYISGIGTSSAFMSIRRNTTSVGTVSLSNVGLRSEEWGRIKLIFNGTSMSIYNNGVFKTTKTLSANDYNRIQFSINANEGYTQRFKNFVIY